MEVKQGDALSLSKGYKQTEIGVIPSDWEVKTLGEVANVVGGGTPSTFNNEFWNGEINWFTPTEIGLKKYSFESERKLTKKGLDSSSARILPIRTILLTSRAGIGDVSILMNEACTNQGFQSLIAKNLVNNEFLYYLVSTLKNVFLQNASGSTFLEISPSKVKAISIPVPTLTEQTAIATALSDADSYIASLEKLIAKKRLVKQGAMQQLLKPKEGWVVKKLGEIGTIVTGSTPPTQIDKYWNGSIPWITPTDISNFEKNIYSSEREITKEGLNVIREVPENTLLVTCIASIGKNAILRKRGSCNQQINALTPKKDYDIDFLYYLIENNKQYILGKAGITATLIISKADFSEIEFSFPSIETQTRIATILSDMDSEIETLEKKLGKAQEIKQGMMQQLLTGKIRLV